MGNSNTSYCYRCGSREHCANFPQCPAIKAMCWNCSKVGHFKVMCSVAQKSSQPSTVAATMSAPISNNDKEFSVFSIRATELTCQAVLINGQSLFALAGHWFTVQHFTTSLCLPFNLLVNHKQPSVKKSG